MNRTRGIKTDRRHSYRSVEAAASEFRRFICGGGDLNSALPGVELFEGFDSATIAENGAKSFRLITAVEDLARDVLGYTAFIKEEEAFYLVLSESTYGGLERNEPRARFSLAHELAHLFLHAGELMRLSALPHFPSLAREASPHQHCEDSEWQADAFAAAALMPASALVLLEKAGMLTTAAVANIFGVSAEAAYYRIDNFKKRRSSLLA